MRAPTIARNYAETLLELARRADDLRGWGVLFDEIATAVQTDSRLRVFLESPRVSGARKSAVLTKAFEGALPTGMLRFLVAVVRNRRQMLIPDIARQYHDLVDAAEGRVHASVIVATEADAAARQAIADRLARVVGKEVVPHVSVQPAILGGLVARIGDTVFDGSVRRRLAVLRSRMLAGKTA